MRRVVALLLATAIGLLYQRFQGGAADSPNGSASIERSESRPTPAGAPASSPSLSPDAPKNARSSVGFRSRARLVEHFQKHGGEFGRVSESEYLARAQALRDAPAGGDVLEVVRPSDGVISRFDRGTGAFLATDADGTIRTFFKPNDGEAYFRRQANRRPSP